MISLTKPRYFVPVHGEYHHLVAHAALAKSMGIPESRVFVMEDGDILELNEDGGQVVGSIPTEHVYLDGHRIIGAKSPVLRDRRALSRDGVVVVVLSLDKATGMAAQPPEIISKGFLDQEDPIRNISESVGLGGAITGPYAQPPRRPGSDQRSGKGHRGQAPSEGDRALSGDNDHSAGGIGAKD